MIKEMTIQQRNVRLAKEAAERRTLEIRRRFWDGKRDGEGHSAAWFQFGRCI